MRLRCLFLRLRWDFLRLQCAFLQLFAASVCARRLPARDDAARLCRASRRLAAAAARGARPPARPPARLLAPPLRAKPLTPRVLSHRRDITPAGTSRRVGALVRLNAELRSDSAAARRCPWQQQVQVPPHHPPAASASLSHATPPPMHTSNATSDPAATGNIRGDEASASTDRHNSSVKLHVFALCGPLQPRWSRGSGEGMTFWRGAAMCLRAHGAFRGAPEASRLRGAAIARRRRLCRSLSHQRAGHSVCARVQCVSWAAACDNER